MNENDQSGAAYPRSGDGKSARTGLHESRRDFVIDTMEDLEPSGRDRVSASANGSAAAVEARKAEQTRRAEAMGMRASYERMLEDLVREMRVREARWNEQQRDFESMIQEQNEALVMLMGAFGEDREEAPESCDRSPDAYDITRKRKALAAQWDREIESLKSYLREDYRVDRRPPGLWRPDDMVSRNTRRNPWLDAVEMLLERGTRRSMRRRDVRSGVACRQGRREVPEPAQAAAHEGRRKEWARSLDELERMKGELTQMLRAPDSGTE